MMLLIKLLIWLLAPVVNAWRDRKGKKPFYLVVNIFRGIALIIHLSLFIPSYAWENYFQYIWPVIIFDLTSFWIVFDLLVNWWQKRKDYPWPAWVFYYDHKEGDSGWTDKIFKWAGLRYYIACKLLALIVCILSVIVIYDRN